MAEILVVGKQYTPAGIRLLLEPPVKNTHRLRGSFFHLNMNSGYKSLVYLVQLDVNGGFAFVSFPEGNRVTDTNNVPDGLLTYFGKIDEKDIRKGDPLERIRSWLEAT